MDDLGGIVRVDAYVFRRQIGGQKLDGGAASPQQDTNLAARLGQCLCARFSSKAQPTPPRHTI